MIYRNRKLLDVSHDAPCMLQISGICRSGVLPSVPCHSNQLRHGKGRSLKAHDCYVVPGCGACHFELDQGKLLSRESKFDIFAEALERYWLWLWQNDKIKVA